MTFGASTHAIENPENPQERFKLIAEAAKLDEQKREMARLGDFSAKAQALLAEVKAAPNAAAAQSKLSELQNLSNQVSSMNVDMASSIKSLIASIADTARGEVAEKERSDATAQNVAINQQQSAQGATIHPIGGDPMGATLDRLHLLSDKERERIESIDPQKQYDVVRQDKNGNLVKEKISGAELRQSIELAKLYEAVHDESLTKEKREEARKAYNIALHGYPEEAKTQADLDKDHQKRDRAFDNIAAEQAAKAKTPEEAKDILAHAAGNKAVINNPKSSEKEKAAAAKDATDDFFDEKPASSKQPAQAAPKTEALIKPAHHKEGDAPVVPPVPKTGSQQISLH